MALDNEEVFGLATKQVSALDAARQFHLDEALAVIIIGISLGAHGAHLSDNRSESVEVRRAHQTN